MDTQTLNAFVEVARCGSFSKAATKLFITQPAISKRISALEQELGVALFNRINRTITLTEAGQALLPRAQSLRNEVEDIRRFASNLANNGDVHNPLSMGTSHHIGLHRLPPVLRQFNQQYPQVKMDLHFVDSEQACQMVERGELEIAVVTLPAEIPPKLQAETIWVDALHMVTATHHPLSEAGSVSLETLIKHPCVLPSPHTYTYQILASAIKPLETALNINMSTNYLETLKMLVGSGFGWSLLPHTMLDDSITPLKTPLSLQRDLGIITHKKRTLSNAATAILSILASHKKTDA